MGFRDWEMAQGLEIRIRVLSVHPLVNAKVNRNLREAYFNGLVFAALCDDFSVDESEKHLLTTIGSALGLDEVFVAETIANTKSVAENDAAKYQAKALFDESLNELRKLPSDGLRRLFAAEFVKVRLLHSECEDELKEGLSKMGATIGTPVEDVLPSIVSIVKAGASASLNDIDKASVLLGDEVVKYFVVHEMGRTDDALAKFRVDELRRTLPERLAAIVEGDDTWPVEFKPADYQPLFEAADIAPEDAGAFVAIQLLPYMKKACETAKSKIDKVPVVHHPDDDKYNGAKFDAVKEFRILFRYAFFVDAFVDLNGIYHAYWFCGPSCSYYLFDINMYEKQITGLKIGDERFDKIRLCFDSYPKVLFDRMRTDWIIRENRVELYFSQWSSLFNVMESFFAKKGAKYEIDEQKCSCVRFDSKFCICTHWCPVDAIKVVGRSCEIDQILCRQCGVCVSRCHGHAIVDKSAQEGSRNEY